MTFIPWTEIESFHNVRKFMKAYPENLNGESLVIYRCKVKLHGTNAAVQVHENGTLVAQSRTAEITPTNDNAGFAKWVHSTDPKLWERVQGLVIFGEWCGPGVQKGVAISEIPQKIFAVFAARFLNGSDDLIVDPDYLRTLLAGIPGVYVLPWYVGDNQSFGIDDESFTPTATVASINWLGPTEELQALTDGINVLVDAVEKNDPWVKEMFNIDGTGEGLVFYPVSQEHLGVKNFNNLVFKAKGEKHKNIKTAAPAQVNAEAAASIDQFADLVLTAARLEQGAMAVMDEPVVAMLTFDMKRIGKFLAWISNDVKKETQDELEASGLTWEQVSKTVSNKARAWYLERAKAL